MKYMIIFVIYNISIRPQAPSGPFLSRYGEPHR